MNAIEVLSNIRTAGGSVTVEDGDLRVSAPAGTITDAQEAVLAKHKGELVELLAPRLTDQAWVDGLSEEEAEIVVGRAIDGWVELVGQSPTLDQIERAIERSFGSVGIEVEARFEHTPGAIGSQEVPESRTDLPQDTVFRSPDSFKNSNQGEGGCNL